MINFLKLFCIIMFANSFSHFDAINQKCYDNQPDLWNRFPFESFLPAILTKYYPTGQNKKVLDIGSGNGVLAEWLIKRDFDVLCVDPSPVMVDRCRRKGLTTLQTTIQNYSPKDKFDLILAILSLIHVPKAEFSNQVRKIASAIDKEGVFILAMIEGNSECLKETASGYPRFFANYTKKEILDQVEGLFELLDYREVRGATNYMVFVFRKWT